MMKVHTGCKVRSAGGALGATSSFSPSPPPPRRPLPPVEDEVAAARGRGRGVRAAAIGRGGAGRRIGTTDMGTGAAVRSRTGSSRRTAGPRILLRGLLAMRRLDAFEHAVVLRLQA